MLTLRDRCWYLKGAAERHGEVRCTLAHRHLRAAVRNDTPVCHVLATVQLCVPTGDETLQYQKMMKKVINIFSWKHLDFSHGDAPCSTLLSFDFTLLSHNLQDIRNEETYYIYKYNKVTLYFTTLPIKLSGVAQLYL